MSLLDYLNGQISEFNRKISNQQTRNTELQAQIDRLKVTKSKLDGLEGQAGTLTSSVKNQDPSEMWAGSEYDHYSESKSQTVTKSDTFKDDITDNYNAVCDKITELQNEQLEGWGFISSWNQGINNARNSIDKWWNDITN